MHTIRNLKKRNEKSGIWVSVILMTGVATAQIRVASRNAMKAKYFFGGIFVS